MDADRGRWDERYAGHASPAPTPPEVFDRRPDLLAHVPRSGRGLDVACGTGGTVLWAAGRGLHVVALDVSPVALALLGAAARAAGLSDRVDAREADLDAGLPASDGPFDLVVCQRFRDPRLYPALLDALAPGGLLVVTVLSVVGASQPGPYHAPAGELVDALRGPGLDLLDEEEAGGLASVVLRRGRADATDGIGPGGLPRR